VGLLLFVGSFRPFLSFSSFLNQDIVEKKKIVISGYYGYKNLGDEAILSAIQQDLQKIDFDIYLTVVSADPSFSEKLHGVKATFREDFDQLVKQVADCDMVILGGGGLFQDHHKINISQFFEDHRSGISSYANLPLMARIHQKPVIYYAQGIGPLFSKQSFIFTRWALNLADRISVRDEYSYLLARNLLGVEDSKIALTYDPALKLIVPSLDKSDYLRRHNIPLNKEIITIAPRFWKHRPKDVDFVKVVQHALLELLSETRNWHVLAIPYHQLNEAENDEFVCGEILRGLPEDSFSLLGCYQDYTEVLAAYAVSSLSIGMRYHSLIFSIIAGTPPIAISYDKKDDSLMRDFGLEDFCYQCDRVEPQQILHGIKIIQEEKSNLQKRLGRRLKQIIRERHDPIVDVIEVLKGL